MSNIKTLHLLKNLYYSSSVPESHESLRVFISTVTKDDYNEKPSAFLKDEQFCGYAFIPENEETLDGKTDVTILKQDKYMFLQFLDGNTEKAAEELWLESLWVEQDLESECYVRQLEEDGKTAYQIMRKVKESNQK